MHFRPSTAVLVGGVSVLCLIWGSTWWVLREGLADVPPLTAAATRFIGAGLIFCVLGPPLARLEGGERPSLRLSATSGVLNVAVAYSVLYWAETILPSGLVAVLWSVFPAMVALVGHFLLKAERLSRRQWGGLLFGMVGVVLLFATDLEAIGSKAVFAGLVLLLSPAASAVGTLVVKRDGERCASALLNRNAMLIGGGLLAALALVFERDAPTTWTRTALLSHGYLLVFGTVVAFGLYYWLLRYARAWQMSLITYVIPCIALAMGSALGGETVGITTLLGLAIILAGVLMMLTKGEKTDPVQIVAR